MIRINLLPFRAARKKENIRKTLSLFLLSMALVVVTLWGVHLYLNGKVKDLGLAVASAQTQLDSFKAAIQEIETIDAQIQAIQRKLDIINSLELNRHGQVKLLSAMTDMVVPNRMWFTSLDVKEVSNQPDPAKRREAKKTAKGKDEPPVEVKKEIFVNVKGCATDNKTIADFMTRLEESPLFTAVTLKTIQLHPEHTDINLKNFEITFKRLSEADIKQKAASDANG